MKSINLNEYIDLRHYSKTETYTQAEVIEAINNLQLVNVVNTLPTENIRNNQIYMIPNHEDINNNVYDLWIYVNNQWEQLDSLEFSIGDYYRSVEVDNLLDLKADVNHGHENATNSRDGFLSSEDKTKLDTVEANANYVILDSTPTANSTNAVSSGSVKTALDGKAPKNHATTTTTYGVGSATNYGHVKASSSVPFMDSENGNIGTDNGLYARADHVHPTDTSRASNSSATSLSAGLMSASDKSKLDGINLNNYYTKSDIDGIVSGLDYGQDVIIESTVTANSNNPVSSKGIKTYVDNAVNNATITDADLINKLNNIVTDMINLSS